MKNLINFINESLESTIKIGNYDIDVITLGDKYGDYYFGSLAILNNPSDYKVPVGPPRLGKKSKLYETMSNMVDVYDNVICASSRSDDKQTHEFINEIEPLLNSDKFEKTKCKDKIFKYDGNIISISGYVYSYKLDIDNDKDYNKLNIGVLDVYEGSYKDIFIYGNQNVIKDLLKNKKIKSLKQYNFNNRPVYVWPEKLDETDKIEIEVGNEKYLVKYFYDPEEKYGKFHIFKNDKPIELFDFGPGRKFHGYDFDNFKQAYDRVKKYFEKDIIK